MLKLNVTRCLCIGIIAGRKITAIDMGAAEPIAMSLTRIEIPFQYLGSQAWAELVTCHCRGLGERAAEAFKDLVLLPRIDRNRRDCEMRRSLKRSWVGQAIPVYL